MPLAVLKNLEIHKVFLRFFALPATFFARKAAHFFYWYSFSDFPKREKRCRDWQRFRLYPARMNCFPFVFRRRSVGARAALLLVSAVRLRRCKACPPKRSQNTGNAFTGCPRRETQMVATRPVNAKASIGGFLSTEDGNHSSLFTREKRETVSKKRSFWQDKRERAVSENVLFHKRRERNNVKKRP